MAAQSSSQKLPKHMNQQRRRKIFVNYVLNFRRVTHFCLFLLEKQVRDDSLTKATFMLSTFTFKKEIQYKFISI